MKKIYKSVENNIEYLVLESDDYYYITNYINKYKPIEGYEDMKYIKHIKTDTDGRIDTNYYYNFLNHNLYSASFTRYYSFNLGCTYGKGYSKEDWIKKSKVILREQKIQKILNNLAQ